MLLGLICLQFPPLRLSAPPLWALCQSPAPVVYVWHLLDAENTAE